MISFIIGSVLTVVVMLGLYLFGLTTYFWNWWFFFVGVSVIDLFFLFAHKDYYYRLMKRFLDKFGDDFAFDEEQRIFLLNAAGIVLPPKLYVMGFCQLESSSLYGQMGFITIALFIFSIVFQNFPVTVISTLLILVGAKIWRPNPFYTANEKLDVTSAVKFYFRAKNMKVKNVSEEMIKLSLQYFINTRDKFNRVWEELRADTESECK